MAPAWLASDPLCNAQFGRKWTDPPPLRRRRPESVPTGGRADALRDNSSNKINRIEFTVQRALQVAERRLLLSIAEHICFISDFTKLHYALKRLRPAFARCWHDRLLYI